MQESEGYSWYTWIKNAGLLFENPVVWTPKDISGGISGKMAPSIGGGTLKDVVAEWHGLKSGKELSVPLGLACGGVAGAIGQTVVPVQRVPAEPWNHGTQGAAG